jgi:predicted enzyme related to lactoylglutathione lyase
VLAAACGPDHPDFGGELSVPDLSASNAFYYYSDVDAAWRFYRDILGLETVVDYGFAKILRVAETSYLTVVAAESGMHSTDEPKTVTLNPITDQLDAWHEHLQSSNVQFLTEIEGRPGSEFVVSDPEGYLLRFQRFNPHPQSPSYILDVARQNPLPSAAGDFGIRAVIYTLYMERFDRAMSFYDRLLSRRPLVRGDWGAIYHIAGSGFLGLSDGADDLHAPTEQNGVTMSFFTSDVDAWFERAQATRGFELRTPEILNESDMVRVFVGYDPEGKFLEWDTFLDLEENRRLLGYLPE